MLRLNSRFALPAFNKLVGRHLSWRIREPRKASTSSFRVVGTDTVNYPVIGFVEGFR